MRHLSERLSSWAARSGAALVSRAEAQAFSRLAEALPVQSSTYYAELRFAPLRQLDLLLALGSDTKSDAIAAIANRRLGWEPSAAAAWERARDLLDRWLRRGSALRPLISRAWLEFDDVNTPWAAVAPSISACLVPGYSGEGRVEPVASREQEIHAAREVYRAIAGEWESRAALDAIEDTVRSLPPTGRVIHVSVMTARTPPTAKLYLVVPRAALVPYLETIAWSGSYSLLERLLAQLATEPLCGADLYVDLNLSTFRESNATLGIAFSRQQMSADPERAQLLRSLVERGQCSERERAALSAWRGPEDPDERRWLDFKTVQTGEQPLQTKVYLGLAHPSSAFASAFTMPSRKPPAPAATTLSSRSNDS